MVSVIERKDAPRIKEIDKIVKNKFRWDWLEKEIATDVGKKTVTNLFSDFIRKVDCAGKAICTWCYDTIDYGGRGFKSLESHARSRKHVQEVKSRSTNYSVAGTSGLQEKPSKPYGLHPLLMTRLGMEVERNDPPQPAPVADRVVNFERAEMSSTESSGVSKSDMLRGIVTEKLNAAAREILAVVERTVADYEEEASGFRQEIDRQRRQLELLQPRVKLERKGDDMESLIFWQDEDEDDKEGLLVQPSEVSMQKREDLKDPDYEVTSRYSFGNIRTRRPSAGILDHICLPFRFLADSKTTLLTKTVFKNSPEKELRCSRDLQESDFLALLRSTFPQLAAGEPFEFFTASRSQRLQPLKLQNLTPENIYKTIKLSRHTAVYIKMKTEQDSENNSKKPDDDTTLISDASSIQDNGRVQPDTSQAEEAPSPHFIRICLLNDSQTDVISDEVMESCLVQELKCPRDLQECDFLDLLRSTFPQLGADEPLDFCITDTSQRLRPLNVKSLTPDEIHKTVGHSALYVRLKTEKVKLHHLPESSNTVETESTKEEVHASPAHHEEEEMAEPSSPQPHCLKKDDCAAECEVDASNDKDEDEPLDRDDKPEQQPPRKMRTRGPRLKIKTPCKVCGICYFNHGSLIKHAMGHVGETPSICGVCGEHFESTDEMQEHLKTHQKPDCSFCGKSFSTVTGLMHHMSLHTDDGQFKCNICGKTFSHMSGLSVHRWVHVEEKLYKCDICPKSFGLESQLAAHRKMHASSNKYCCSVCGRSTYDLKSLTRHKLIHTGERPHLCQVCGKHFKTISMLRAHKKTHTERERLHMCHICCKTFMSNLSLTAHLKTHSSEKPFPCNLCGKAFHSNSILKVHMRVHTGEKPYGYSECGLFFKYKSNLRNHLRILSGVGGFLCSVCGKTFIRQEHLKVHMRSHSGEKPYKCTICKKAFTQGHCLKMHMMTRHTEKKTSMSPPTS
ncbi:uncharacterized protein KZ484_001126 isoform 2-T2 [Pholidichthys leucotaenia]